MSGRGDESSKRFLALDIGGTKVDAGVVTSEGAIERRLRLDVGQAGKSLHLAIADALRELSAGLTLRALGVGCAGPMDHHGESVSPLNIAAWDNFPLRSFLHETTGLPVAVRGDVQALALAEGYVGGAVGQQNFASLVVSTGVGGALVIDGKLLEGRTGNAGHLGHLIVEPGGRRCSCESRGCLEAEASGWAIAEMTGAAPSLAPASVRDRTAIMVGRAVGSLMAVLDFDTCFVAGSVALGFGEPFFARATQIARDTARIAFSRSATIRPSELGSDGPLLGAARVAPLALW